VVAVTAKQVSWMVMTVLVMIVALYTGLILFLPGSGLVALLDRHGLVPDPVTRPGRASPLDDPELRPHSGRRVAADLFAAQCGLPARHPHRLTSPAEAGSVTG
jgi:hypothetical protein